MLVSLDLPANVAAAVSLEAGRCGQTTAQWITDRLADRFGLRPVASASRVWLLSPDTVNPNTTHDD